MYQLTLQLHLQGRWHDAMQLTFDKPESGMASPCSLGYQADYLVELLDQILGNSDNHGRNIAILRDEERLRLAPIYDLAPMVMDEEGITRTTKWPPEIERAGEVDWLAACQSLAAWADAQVLYEGLREDARTFRALPDLLTDLPEQTRNHPRIPLNRLDSRLRAWGLL